MSLSSWHGVRHLDSPLAIRLQGKTCRRTIGLIESGPASALRPFSWNHSSARLFLDVGCKAAMGMTSDLHRQGILIIPSCFVCSLSSPVLPFLRYQAPPQDRSLRSYIAPCYTLCWTCATTTRKDLNVAIFNGAAFANIAIVNAGQERLAAPSLS